MSLLPGISDGLPVEDPTHRRGVLGRCCRHRRTVRHLHHLAWVTTRTGRDRGRRGRLGARRRLRRPRGLSLPVLAAGVVLTSRPVIVFPAITVTLAVRAVFEIVGLAVIVSAGVFKPVSTALTGKPTQAAQAAQGVHRQ